MLRCDEILKKYAEILQKEENLLKILGELRGSFKKSGSTPYTKNSLF